MTNINTPRGSIVRIEKDTDGKSAHLIIHSTQHEIGVEETQLLLSSDNIDELIVELEKVQGP